jgi:hypothetical protein
MGWEHEVSHSAGVHTCHIPDSMNLVPALLAWHSTLYNRHSLHTKATYQNRFATQMKWDTSRNNIVTNIDLLHN